TGATGGTPIPPLLLLGSGGSLITIPGSNNTITVNGPVTLNSSSASAINEPGKNNVISSSTNTLNLLSPGGMNLSSGDTVPPTTYVTSVTDPFASLAAPAGISSIAVCTGLSTSTWTCPPGLYVTGLSVPSGTTVNFTGGGTYEFGDTLKMSGGGTVNFGGGIYVFDNGVALSGSGNTLSSTSGASGVLLYIAGGALAMPASSVSISLSAATTGTYAGILLFQSHSDCSGMQIPGSSNSVNTYGGVIYAHCTVSGKSTTLTIPGSSSGLKAGGLIVDAIQIPGSTNTVNLGS
ncbi:MAG TPA: hypothetical protein VE991_12900, partial [Acidimicrobiales bacterium]|nr:hypothetical protein [Acidimicrobiales bacterium]